MSDRRIDALAAGVFDAGAVKVCPNPQCRHVLRHRSPAEFLPHATSCNDCGMSLVAREALTAPETAAAVRAFVDARRVVEAEAALDPAERARSARIDISAGAAILLGCAVALVWANVAVGPSQLSYGAIAVCAYGVLRIGRGLDARRAPRARG